MYPDILTLSCTWVAMGVPTTVNRLMAGVALQEIYRANRCKLWGDISLFNQFQDTNQLHWNNGLGIWPVERNVPYRIRCFFAIPFTYVAGGSLYFLLLSGVLESGPIMTLEVSSSWAETYNKRSSSLAHPCKRPTSSSSHTQPKTSSARLDYGSMFLYFFYQDK